ncbi:nuclear envelope pore membrane protein POM 121 [Cynoglossus semilaevis]|uniref:POM121 transmembrane nucleoporin n=1 Tax=Cynoglossus semilaevis TaxID=244447 RepID=A0A3P8VEE9_CYNSE|nr:nuclear envelope pore membrane protein POM 121 [Cynoglossus semilaevis]
MRVLRRRVAAMSPREKQIAIFSLLGVITLALYCSPFFLFTTLALVACFILCYSFPAWLGLNPRAGLKEPGVLGRWLLGLGVTGVSVPTRRRTKTSDNNRNERREAERNFVPSHREAGIYRGEALSSDSFLFSPRDFLMGSYIGKPESPSSEFVRPRVVRNPREQLRDKLSRPNHAVCTPNRRLSFAGEPTGTVGRFSITPHRHYPLQQPGASSVGVLPPVRWDGFRKKNILSPRNSSATHSPVTVKIARPNHSSPRLDRLSCTGLLKAPVDPCSRESVLKVLKESRKREVEDEDRSFTTEQHSKRRRNDSGGSSNSAFEPLLPNGIPSQLVPKPGTLKRGLASLEESIVKRSRTSSISSGSGIHAPRGTPGGARNPIFSSYSSSHGLSQWTKPSTPSSPLSSPGSSRCQTPEGASKRPREDDALSPSSASSVRSERTALEKAPITSKLTPIAKIPIATSVDSTGSGGKRKRKIQLVSSNREDQISLPPPPELGYSITVKDIDEEKKAAISKIQKVLETPAPEPEKPVSSPVTTSTVSASTSSFTAASSTTTLSSLLAAPLPKTSSSAVAVINLDPSPGKSVSTTPAAPNPLLEALKRSSAPGNSTAAATTTTVSVPVTTVPTSGLDLKPAAAMSSPQLPAASQTQPTSTSSSTGAQQPPAFTQVLDQVFKSSSSTPPVAGLPSQNKPLSAPATSVPVSACVAPASSSASVSHTNPLLTSGFKPIFGAVATTAAPAASSTSSTSSDSKPVQTFTPIFGGTSVGAVFGQPASLSTTNPTMAVSSSSTSSIFGMSTNSANTTPASSPFPSLNNLPTGTAASTVTNTTQPVAQQSVNSVFGSWSAPPATTNSSAIFQAPSTGSTYQFGAVKTTTTTTTAAAAPAPAPAAATTSSSNTTFTFGAAQPDSQAASQKVFAFGQPAPSQNLTTASFGGFAMATSAQPTTTSNTQSTFTFGKSSFDAPTTQPTFGSSTTQPKPFTFGGSTASTTPASTPTAAPFTFGAGAAVAAAATTAPTFGTPAKPAFGAGSAGFAFGSSTPAAAMAPPSFGAAPAQTQSSSSTTFTFGSSAPQPTMSAPSQPATGGFNFGSGMSCPQFGTPVPNNPAPQMGGFNFGAAAAEKPVFGTSTPSFGQSTAVGPVPFGSPATPLQGFSPSPFGSPATPSFSIGAGSKPSGARQRLQARRQHNRKK